MVEFQKDVPATLPEGFTPATDKVDGEHYQKVKIVTGKDGIIDDPISGDDPFPIKIFDDALREPRNLELLVEISTTLKKIERHLSFATDTEINDQDV